MTENLTQKLKKKKGFTLIELIIVVAIIAILAALAIPKLMGTQDNAKKKTDVANGKMIHDSVAKLMTEDKLLPGTVSATTTFNVATDTTTTTPKGITWNELQSKPEPKYDNSEGTKHFIVQIDTDKNIAVYVGKGTTDIDKATDKQVYPTTESPYK